MVARNKEWSSPFPCSLVTYQFHMEKPAEEMLICSSLIAKYECQLTFCSEYGSS